MNDWVYKIENKLLRNIIKKFLSLTVRKTSFKEYLVFIRAAENGNMISRKEIDDSYKIYIKQHVTDTISAINPTNHRFGFDISCTTGTGLVDYYPIRTIDTGLVDYYPIRTIDTTWTINS